MFPVAQTATSFPRRVEISHLRPAPGTPNLSAPEGELLSLKGAAPLRSEPRRGQIDTGANSQPRGLGKNTSSCGPGARPGPGSEGRPSCGPAGDARSDRENCPRRQSRRAPRCSARPSRPTARPRRRASVCPVTLSAVRETPSVSALFFFGFGHALHASGLSAFAVFHRNGVLLSSPSGGYFNSPLKFNLRRLSKFFTFI